MSYPNQPGDGYGQQPPFDPGNPYGQGVPPGSGGSAPNQGYPAPGYPGGYPNPAAPPGYPPQYGVSPAYGADPYAPFGRDPRTGQPLSDKSKLTAGLLQIFLGGFGIGRFYLGYSTIGALQLVVSLLTCGLGALWPLIDGILIIMGNVPDPYGRPLRD